MATATADAPAGVDPQFYDWWLKCLKFHGYPEHAPAWPPRHDHGHHGEPAELTEQEEQEAHEYMRAHHAELQRYSAEEAWARCESYARRSRRGW
jgi:hypothetical protein